MNRLFAELLCWDNEGAAAEGAAAEGAAAAGAAAAAAAAGAAGKTFTQDEVNKFVAERNKAVNTKFEQLKTSYEGLLKQQNLTNEQRANLETELEAVRREMMTKEQRLEDDKKKDAAKHEQELAKVAGEAKKYKELFETSSIARAITDAALTNDAFNPKHFIAHLAPESQMVEEVDAAGALTGKLVAMVKWTSVDKEGKKHVSMKTPEEAVKLMKENVVEFGNLFRTNVAAGIGAGTAPGQLSSAGQIDHARISTDDYMQMAKTAEGRKKLGLLK